jgi:hypothetical protein
MKTCKDCYGKGYSTEFVGKTSYIPDFEPAVERAIRNEHIQVNLCTCDRGKQLKKYFIVKKQYR